MRNKFYLILAAWLLVAGNFVAGLSVFAQDLLNLADSFPTLDKSLLDRDRKVAELCAPIFYQNVAGDRRGDYITNFDFDGDWIGNNNWVNFESKKFPLKAYVYYAVVETDTHFFVTYAAYHPIDWKGRALDKMLEDIEKNDPERPVLEALKLGHENDMEGAMVVAEKQGDDIKSLKVIAVETLAHDKFYVYKPVRVDTQFKGKIPNDVVFTEGTHPLLFVEAKGHGIKRHEFGKPFSAKDGIIYKYRGVAEDPDLVKEQEVDYDLIHIYPTLWKKASEPFYANLTYGDFIDYGFTKDRYVGFLGAAFKGDRGGVNRAKPPWGWSDGQLGPGEWFFDAARVVKTHLKAKENFSADYIYHPYLGILPEGKPTERARELIRDSEQTIKTCLEKGGQFLDRHEPERAVDLYRLSLRLDPNNYDAHCGLGLALLVIPMQTAMPRGDRLLKAAQKEAEIATGLNPGGALGHAVLAIALALNNNSGKALTEANKAVAMDSENALAHLAQGLASKLEGQNDQAIAAFQKYLTFNPNDDSIRRELESLIKAKSIASKELAIPGNVPWLDTEMDVAQGERISIHAEGQIGWGREADQVCGPDGIPRKGFFKPMPEKNTGALIGKIGEKGDRFLVGSHSDLTVQKSGRLYLGINDDNHSDNSGFFIVRIRRK